MKSETKQIVGMAIVIGLLMVVLITFSNIARQNHDAEVRKQTIETCKEIK